MSDHTFTLANGLKLGYAEFGDPRGEVAFYFHGWPSSRIQGSLFDDVAKQQGMRKGGAALQEILPLRLLPRINRYGHNGSTMARTSRWICSIDAPASSTRTRPASSRARRR